MQREIATSPDGPRYARVAVIRAIPNPPHKRRWCGAERWVPDPQKRPQQEMREKATGGLEPVFDDKGRPVYAKHALPWPDFEVKVGVVDEPAPFDPDANGGVPVEISPQTLAMLEKDHRIAVKVISGEGGDPAEVIRAKAEAASLEQQLADARRQLAEMSEREKLVREAEAMKAAGEVAKLRQELAELRAQAAGKKK